MTLTMYDSVDVSALPPGADAYAGYVDGQFRTFPALRRRFRDSGAHLLSIAVFVSGNADALDVEPTDATNAQAPGWVKRQRARGVFLPCLYTSVSNMDALVATLHDAGIPRTEVRLWSAHYEQGKHICGPRTCGLTRHACNGTQWTDVALGRNLDESVLHNNFFARPAPANKLITEETMLLKAGAGAVTPVAIPHGASHVRLLAQNTATVEFQFHGHPDRTIKLSWEVGSHRMTIPKNIFAARVRRVDGGTGDVSLVCE